MAKNLVTLNVENVDYSIRPYGTCSTSDTVSAKTVNISGFTLCTGATVLIKFTSSNKSNNITLNVNGTGAKPVQGLNDVFYQGVYYEFLYDGANWVEIGERLNHRCSSYTGNNNNYPYRRIASTNVVSTMNINQSTTLILKDPSVGGKYGELCINYYTSYEGKTASYEIYWIINKGFNDDHIKIGFINTPGAVCMDVFYKNPSAWAALIVEQKMGGKKEGASHFNVNNGEFKFINSYEVSNTTTTDKLTSYECYKTIESAATELYGKAYSIITAPNNGTNEPGKISFNGDLTGNATTATTATNATNVNIATSSSNSDYPLLFTTNVTAGNKRVYTDSANELKYNPSTNTLTTSKFVGDLAGNLTLKSLALCSATESDEIKIVENANNAITTNPTNTTGISSIRKALDFRWYDSHWQIGNIRAGSSASDGFGITYGNNNLRFRVTTTDCFVGADKILHASNYTSYTVKKDGTGASGTWPISITGNAATIKQTVSTLNANYPLLLAPSGQTATNNSGGTYFDSEVTLNPSTNILNNAKVYESLIQWGNTNISGSVTPVDAAMASEFSQNRLSFLNPDLITIEFTRNNGTNWYTYPKTYTDAGTTDTVASGYEVITNTQKQSLVTDGLSHTLYLGARKGNQTVNDKLRITILGDGVGLFIKLRKILFYYSQANGKGNYCLVEAASAATPDTFTTVKQYDVSGWTDWNSIPYDKSLGEWADSSRASNTRKLRLTFGVTGVTANTSTDIYVNRLRMFGPTSHAGGNSLTKTGHLYSFDVNKNATFPANLTTTGTLTVKGNTTLGDATSDTVTVSGSLTVKGNTTLGDATSDTVTINGKTTIASGSKLIIKGNAASQPLVVRNVTGSDGEGGIGPLYLQYGANNAINLGNGGSYSISADGGTYSGTATTATNIVTSNIATTAEIEALFA